MSMKTIAAIAVTLAGGWFAAGYYGISLDPRDHLPIETFCYVERGVLHVEQTNSFNMDREPRVTKSFRAEMDRSRIFVSDSYSPEGGSLRDIELFSVSPSLIEINIRPGVLKNIVYSYRNPDASCPTVIRDYFAMSHIVLPRIID